MATKKPLNREQYDALIAHCKSAIREFFMTTPYTILQYARCDHDPDREVWILNVPTMGDIEFHFNSFESDRANDHTGVAVVSLPIIFKEYRNQTPFDLRSLKFNNLNGKCTLLAFADKREEILVGVEKVLQIASNVVSQPFYWLQQGAKVYWDDPEAGLSSGVYEVYSVPDDIDRQEWEDDLVVGIANEYSEAEVPISEIRPALGFDR